MATIQLKTDAMGGIALRFTAPDGAHEALRDHLRYFDGPYADGTAYVQDGDDLRETVSAEQWAHLQNGYTVDVNVPDPYYWLYIWGWDCHEVGECYVERI